MTHMSFGIQNDQIRYTPRGPQQTRSGVNWKSGGCGPIFQQNTVNVTYEAPTTPWDTTAGKVSLWTGAISGGLGFLARGMQTLGLTKFPFVQRFVQSFGNQSMTYPSYGMGGTFGMGGYTNPLGMGTYSPFSFGGGCTNTYGMLNTGMQQSVPTGNVNYQQNLSQMYSSYKVLDNGNGTYTLTTGKGDNVKTGTFEELMKGMDGDVKPAETQGTGAVKPAETQGTGAVKPEETQGTGAVKPEAGSTPANTDTGKAKVPTAEQMKDFKGKITVHDDVFGVKGDITGNTEITAGSESTKGYPESVKVGKYSYSFAKVENGVVWYKSKNGDGQLYRLEQNSDGTYGLNQHEGDDGAGTADIHRNSTPTASTPTASKAKPEDADDAASQATSDKDYLEHMNVQSDLSNNHWGSDGKIYYAQTVTCTIIPYESSTISVPAETVAKFGGDEAQIKQYALEQMKKEQENK